MKKIFVILLCGLCDLYAQAIIKFDNKYINIEYKIKEIEDIIGKSIKIAEIPFCHNLIGIQFVIFIQILKFIRIG